MLSGEDDQRSEYREALVRQARADLCDGQNTAWQARRKQTFIIVTTEHVSDDFFSSLQPAE